MNEKCLGSVAFNIRLSFRKSELKHKLRMDEKLKKRFVRQDRPFKEQSFDSIRKLDVITFQTFVKDLMFYSPKHPFRD